MEPRRNGRVFCSQINRIVKGSGTEKKTTPMLSVYERNRLLSFYWACICAHMRLRVSVCVYVVLSERDKTPKIQLHIRTRRIRSHAIYTKMCRVLFFIPTYTKRCRVEHFHACALLGVLVLNRIVRTPAVVQNVIYGLYFCVHVLCNRNPICFGDYCQDNVCANTSPTACSI